jgi:Pyruvate/2-oxoacid:ferredoxin oxidoreductase delta subunit
MTLIKCASKNKRRLPPCRAACPADVNVQGYIALLQQGKFKESVELVRKSIPFPAICGRVCYCPCEDACARRNVDEAVSIRALKRLIADIEREQGRVKSEPISKTRREKVAIIGAGPAGLTAAYELSKLGYPITVFEAMPEPGGTMRYFIPDSRLRKDVVANEIAYIRDVGVEIKTGVVFGKDLTIVTLRNDGYKAILIAIGTQRIWNKELKTQETSLIPTAILNIEKGEAPAKPSTISVDPLTLKTRIPSVFAGGDAVTGKASGIAYAIGAGKRAAVSIDRYLCGQDLRAGREEDIEETTWVEDWEKITRKHERYITPRADIGKQMVSFEEADDLLTKTKEVAILEAQRCLECGPCTECLGSIGLCEADKAVVDETLCTGCNVCTIVCPFGAIKKDGMGSVQVNEDLCKGCGICSASCPERAISMQQLTNSHIVTQVATALGGGSA